MVATKIVVAPVKKMIKKPLVVALTKVAAAKKPAKKAAAKKSPKKKAPKKKAAKKAPKKKKAKKPKKKKKKKKKKAKKPKKKRKKKAKKVRFVGGKRAKGQHKSKASSAAGKKIAAKMKAKGIGLFAPKSISADLAAITGKNKMPRTEVTKSIWAYIKKNKLNKGRTIHPDAKLKKVLPANSLSMFKIAGMLSKHIK
jgi:chromatin remodeling complex protein RSC6